MNVTDNPYTILGISQDADEDEVKKAYRKAARLYHPDMQTNEEERKLATDTFAKIAEAYSLLNDPVRRYDWRQANENSNHSSTSRRSPMPTKRSSRNNSAAPSRPAHRSVSPGPGRSQRSAASSVCSAGRSQRSATSSVCSAGTRSTSTQSSSSTCRRKSRVRSSRSPQRSAGRRTSPKLPVREDAQKPIRRRASLGSNKSTRSNSSVGRRKRRGSCGRSPKPSSEGRTSSHLRGRETAKKSMHRTTNPGSNMPGMRRSINEPTVRSSTKPKRPSRPATDDSLPTRVAMNSRNPKSEKGRKKSTVPLESTPMQGRRLHRMA